MTTEETARRLAHAFACEDHDDPDCAQARHEIEEYEEQWLRVAALVEADTARLRKIEAAASLRAALREIAAEVEGSVDGTPDAGPTARLANAVHRLAAGALAEREETR